MLSGSGVRPPGDRGGDGVSIHRSLTTSGGLVRSRNVLTRYERILELRKTGKWKEGDEASPFGLPKVRVMRIKKRGKEKKKEAEAK